MRISAAVLVLIASLLPMTFTGPVFADQFDDAMDAYVRRDWPMPSISTRTVTGVKATAKTARCDERHPDFRQSWIASRKKTADACAIGLSAVFVVRDFVGKILVKTPAGTPTQRPRMTLVE